MKAADECYGCLERLARQAATLATDDELARATMISESLELLRRDFSCGEVSIVVATRIHDLVKARSGNSDPYREMKDGEIAIARGLCKEVQPGHDVSGFEGCLEVAVLGNAIDFFRPVEIIKRDLTGEVCFAINDSKLFAAKIKRAGKVLYLADNAGEVFFDLPLLSWMRQFGRVTYVVKDSPVQNDVTPEDVRRMGLEVGVGDMMTTGTATPGVDFAQASSEFKRQFLEADLILAKGMGYYESLSELSAEGKVLHCLMAKCRPVARSLGVPLNSHVALLR